MKGSSERPENQFGEAGASINVRASFFLLNRNARRVGEQRRRVLLEVAPARVGERLELLGALEEQVVVRRAVLAPAGEVRLAAVVPRRAG